MLAFFHEGSHEPQCDDFVISGHERCISYDALNMTLLKSDEIAKSVGEAKADDRSTSDECLPGKVM